MVLRLFRAVALLFVISSVSAQTVEWGKRLTGNHNYASFVKTIPGGAYVVGDLFPTPSTPEVFILRYDTQGNVVWERRLTFGNWGGLYEILVDTDGGLFLLGSFDESVFFRNQIVENTSTFDAMIFIAKYSIDGEQEWLTTLPHGILTQQESLAIDSDANVYVFCQQYKRIDVNTITLSEKGSFVLKYDPHGVFLEEISLIGDYNVWSHSLEIDPDNNMLMVCEFFNQLSIQGNDIQSNDVTLADAIMAKFTPDGSLIWWRNIGRSNGRDFVKDMTIDGLGNIYLTASHPDGSVFSAYDSEGMVKWDLPGKYDGAWLTNAQVDEYGGVYLAGAFTGALTLGNKALTPVTSASPFMAKVKPNGTVDWVVQAEVAPAGREGHLEEISWSNGDLYLVGSTFSQSLKFESVILLNTTDHTNSLIFKVKEPAYRHPLLDLGPDRFICENEEIKISAGGFASYRWNDGSTDSLIVVKEPGEYFVEAMDFHGKTYRDTVTVDACREIFVPNVITPNGDQWNEYFEIVRPTDASVYQLTVFDRWGEVLFVEPVYKDDWNGQGLDTGVYYYEIRSGSDGSVYKGWVHLLK